MFGYYDSESFNPENIKKSDMDKLADSIEEYLEELERCMIIPEEVLDKYEDKIKEGIKRSRQLIKKLRKGDRSVFKDEDEL